MEQTTDQRRAPKDAAKKAMMLKNDKNERNLYILSVWTEFVKKFVTLKQPELGAAIFEYKNGDLLSSTPGFKITKNELRDILMNVTKDHLTHVTVNGMDFQTVVADGKFGIYSKNSTQACSICKTETLVTIWIHDSGNTGAKCNEELMKLGDCFRSWEL